MPIKHVELPPGLLQIFLLRVAPFGSVLLDLLHGGGGRVGLLLRGFVLIKHCVKMVHTEMAKVFDNVLVLFNIIFSDISAM